MKCIIPLAGPDFIMEDGGIRPLFSVDGEPLLLKAIRSRPWFKSSEMGESDIIIVLRQTDKTAEFLNFLKENLPLAKVVIIPQLTSGALLSSISGISQITNFDEPICIDLVDILYDTIFSPKLAFEDPHLFGVIPYFYSRNEKYSYLRVVNGWVKQTAEKKVISEFASAGTYFFKDTPTFLQCIMFSMKTQNTISYNDNLFICPSFNALTVQDKLVKPVEVTNVISISELFH